MERKAKTIVESEPADRRPLDLGQIGHLLRRAALEAVALHFARLGAVQISASVESSKENQP